MMENNMSNIQNINEIKRQIEETLKPYAFIPNDPDTEMGIIRNRFAEIMQDGTNKHILASTRIEGNNIYLESLTHMETIPFMLAVEPDREYNVFYNQLEGCKGTVNFKRVAGKTKIIWYTLYTPNEPINQIVIDIKLDK